jgi:phosphate:Na+ symporter
LPILAHDPCCMLGARVNDLPTFMLTDAATAFAGLGMFFAGLHLLAAALRKLSDRRFRRILSRWTHRGPISILCGVAAGAMTQSTTAVLFMLIGMVRTGVITVDSAVPLVAGANLGSSALAFLTAVNVDLVMLLLLGASGFLIAREKAALGLLAGLTFSLGVIFLGLQQIKTGALPVLDLEWVRALLQQSHGSVVVAVLVGLALRLVVHSSVAIVILAATLAAAKVLSLAQAVAVVAGVVAGSATAVGLLSMRHQGRARQVAAFTILSNLLGVVMLLALFVNVGGTPLVLRLLSAMSGHVELQVASALLLAYLPGVALVPLRHRMTAIFARIWPPTEEEGNGACRYISDDALADPESALDLAELEQRDLTSFFSRYLQLVRANASPEALHDAFRTRLRLLNDFIEELAVADLSNGSYQRVAALINSQRLLEATGTTLYDFVTTVALCGPRLAGITDIVIEAMDGVLLTLEAALSQPDEDEMQMLRTMTGNRSSALQALRESFIAHEGELDSQSRFHLLAVTNVCERFFWLMGTFIETPVVQPQRIAAAPAIA